MSHHTREQYEAAVRRMREQGIAVTERRHSATPANPEPYLRATGEIEVLPGGALRTLGGEAAALVAELDAYATIHAWRGVVTIDVSVSRALDAEDYAALEAMADDLGGRAA